MNALRRLTAIVVCSLHPILLAGAASPQADAATEAPGEVHFETSCSPAVGSRFDRAVALLHHMTYAGARSGFAAIASDHPTCAMAHWGIAMTLFQPLWPTRPGEAELERGREELARVEEIGPETARERMFIDAAMAFFDPAHQDYWARIAAWAERTRAVYEAYPEDLDAAAFFALSHLATAPRPPAS